MIRLVSGSHRAEFPREIAQMHEIRNALRGIPRGPAMQPSGVFARLRGVADMLTT